MINQIMHWRLRIEDGDSGQGRKSSLRSFLKTLPVWATVIFSSTLFASGCCMLAIALFANGCSRKSSDAFSSQPYVQTNQTAETTIPAPSAQPPPSGAPIVQADGQPNMVELNRAAKFWMFRNRRRPTSWDDFAANAGIQIPPPPSGKKYVLSKDMRITLVDQ
ncbi:MAG TPA: hypothetical protein VGJ73_06965 [Verrucomicrobiae bacterium]|jgi:hypothetical protein